MIGRMVCHWKVDTCLYAVSAFDSRSVCGTLDEIPFIYCTLITGRNILKNLFEWQIFQVPPSDLCAALALHRRFLQDC